MENQTSIADMISTATNLDLNEQQMQKNAVLALIITKDEEDVEKGEAKLTCVVQGKAELLINGLANAMKQDSQLEAMLKEAIKRTNPLHRLMMAMINSIDKDVKDAEEGKKDESNDSQPEQTNS